MVNHESYRSAEGPNGVWLYPEEVEKRPDGTVVQKTTGEPVIVGRVEAMSKSRRNTIDPGDIIERYGADTARWFILSDNKPPDRDMEVDRSRAPPVPTASRSGFSVLPESDRAGSAPSQGLPRPASARPATFGQHGNTLRRVAHKTIAAVTEALDSFAFNVAVARLYELANAR